MDCPRCKKGPLRSTDTPFWDFPLLTCPCGFFGNRIFVEALSSNTTYDDILRHTEQPQRYAGFAAVVERQLRLREFYNLCVQHLQTNITEAYELAAKFKISSALRLPVFQQLIGFCPRSRAREYTDLIPEIPHGDSFVLPLMAMPDFISAFVFLNKRGSKVVYPALLGPDQPFTEAGLYPFSKSSSVVAIADPALALWLLTKRAKNEDSELNCPITLFVPGKEDYSWEMFGISTIIVPAGKYQMDILRQRRIDTRFRYSQHTEQELMSEEFYISPFKLAEIVIQSSVDWQHLAYDIIRTSPLSGAYNFCANAGLDQTALDELSANAPDDIKAKTTALAREREMTSLRTAKAEYSRLKGGGIGRAVRGRDAVTIANLDLRVSRLYNSPTAQILEGDLCYQSHLLPFRFSMQELRGAPGYSALTTFCNNHGLSGPELSHDDLGELINVCLRMSKPEIVTAYDKVSYDRDKKQLVLPGIAISPEGFTDNPQVLTDNRFRFPQIKWKHARIIDEHLEPVLWNELIWSGIIGAAIMVLRKPFGIDEGSLFLIGNKKTLAEDLRQWLGEQLNLSARHIIPGYPFLAQQPEIDSICCETPLAGALAALDQPYIHFIPALYSRRAVNTRLLSNLIGDFIRYFLDRELPASDRCFCTEVAMALYEFVKTKTKKSPQVVANAAKRIRCGTVLAPSAHYDSTEPSIRYLGLVKYLQSMPLVEDGIIQIQRGQVVLFPRKILRNLSRITSLPRPIDMSIVVDSLQSNGHLLKADSERLILDRQVWKDITEGWSRAEEAATILRYHSFNKPAPEEPQTVAILPEPTP